MTNRLEHPEDRNVLILVKGDERYVFVYEDADRSEVLRTIGQLSMRIRKQMAGQE